MRLIADGVVDRDGVPGLAPRLGYSSASCTGMLTAELGAGPLALARAQRAQTARILIETTDLADGRDRLRGRLRAACGSSTTPIREVFAATPRREPARRPGAAAGRRRAGAGAPSAPAGRTARRCDAGAAAGLPRGCRAMPGVEEVRDGDVPADAPVAARRRHRGADPGRGHVAATLRLADLRDLAPAVQRCRRLLDLDADPVAIDAHARLPTRLWPRRRRRTRRPGRPGAVDGFELAVRAMHRPAGLGHVRKSNPHPPPGSHRVDHEVDEVDEDRTPGQPHDHGASYGGF